MGSITEYVQVDFWLHIISTELCFIFCMCGFKMIGICEFYLLLCSWNYLVFSAFCLFHVIFMQGIAILQCLVFSCFLFSFLNIPLWSENFHNTYEYMIKLAVRYYMLLKQFRTDEKWVFHSVLVVYCLEWRFWLWRNRRRPWFLLCILYHLSKGPLLYATICNCSSLLMRQIGLQNNQIFFSDLSPSCARFFILFLLNY